MKIKIKQIIPLENVRDGDIKESDVKGLMNNIKSVGLLQPLVVSTSKEKDKFNLLAGYRRLKALQLLGFKDVEVMEVGLDVDGLKPAEAEKAIQISENIHRLNLTLKEEVVAILTYLKLDYSPIKISQIFGKSLKWVKYRLSLGNLIPALFKELDSQQISIDTLHNISKYSHKEQTAAYKKFDGIVWRIHDILGLSDRTIESMYWTEDSKEFGKACNKCKDRYGCQIGIFKPVFDKEKDRCINEKCYMDKLEKRIKSFLLIFKDEGLILTGNGYYYNPDTIGQLKVTQCKKIKTFDLMHMEEKKLRKTIGKFTHYNLDIEQNDTVFMKTKGATAESKSDSGAEDAFELSTGAIQNLRRDLYLPIANALYSKLEEMEQYLAGPITTSIVNFALMYKSQLSMVREYDGCFHSVQSWEIKADEKSEMNSTVRGYYTIMRSIVKSYMFKGSMNVLIGNGSSGHQYDNYSLNEKSLPSIAKLLNFDFGKWLIDYIKDDELRTSLYGRFTKVELAEVMTEEKRKENSGKAKIYSVDSVVVSHAKKFPHIKALLKSENFMRYNDYIYNTGNNEFLGVKSGK